MCLIKTFSMKSINCFRLCRDSFFTWMYTVNILQYISCIHQEHIWLILSFLSHSLYAADNSNCCNSSIRSTMPKNFILLTWHVIDSYHDYELSNFVWISQNCWVHRNSDHDLVSYKRNCSLSWKEHWMVCRQ